MDMGKYFASKRSEQGLRVASVVAEQMLSPWYERCGLWNYVGRRLSARWHSQILFD